MRFTLAIISACLALASCNKEYCWECDVNSAGITYKETYCDRSKKQISDMQNNPLQTKDNTGAVIYTTTFSNCVRR